MDEELLAGRRIALSYLKSRRDQIANLLPPFVFNLPWFGDRRILPHGEGGGGRGNGRVKRLGGEQARRLQPPPDTVRPAIHQRLVKSNAVQQLFPCIKLNRPERASECELP